jgi:hypothetical protein
MAKLIFGDPKSIEEARKGISCKNCDHSEEDHNGYCFVDWCGCAKFSEKSALDMA